MTFIEAVEALKSGECEGIKRECWEDSVVWLIGIDTLLVGDDCDLGTTTENQCVVGYCPDVCGVLATDWELVNPRPRTERQEVKRWGVIWASGVFAGTYPTLKEAKKQCGMEAITIELTGSYEVEVPRKAKKRVEVGIYPQKNSMAIIAPKFNANIVVPEDAKLFAEWEE